MNLFFLELLLFMLFYYSDRKVTNTHSTSKKGWDFAFQSFCVDSYNPLNYLTLFEIYSFMCLNILPPCINTYKYVYHVCPGVLGGQKGGI